MSAHHFDPNIAAQVGCNAAVIYQNLLYWAEKNAANGRHFYDGRWWTYNSISAFSELFPYLSGKQIRSALDKLESVGLIVTGCYNKSAYDRTKWYAPTCLNTVAHLPKRSNENDQKGEPIPDINTDNKPDNKTPYSPPLPKEPLRKKNITAHEMPEDWQPVSSKEGSASRDIVDGWPPDLYATTLEAFTAYHRSKGNKFKNWQDAWSTWVLNSRKFKNGTTNRTTNHTGTTNGFAAALRYVADGRTDDPF